MSRMSRFDEKEIIQMYKKYNNDNISSVKLAKEYGCSPSTIISLFKNRG